MNKSLAIAPYKILIAIVTIIVVSGLSWLLYNASTTRQPKTVTPQELGVLVLDTKKIPGGWTIDVNEPTHVGLNNNATKCFVDLYKDSDKVIKSANADTVIKQQNDLSVSTIQSKGYEVVQLPNSELTVVTGSGQLKLPVLMLSLTGPSAFTQAYSYIVKDGYLIQIQLSCDLQSDMNTTNQALLAITVNN